jgi:hypothetical protein
MMPEPSTPCLCPECGAPIDLDEDALAVVVMWRANPGGVPYVEEVARPAVVGFCTGCEFAIEVRQP